jgi:hypothetical protein
MIHFGKDRYHLQGEMQGWCEQHFGPGKWTGGQLKTWEGMDRYNWVISSMFGNTFFQFRKESDAVLFALKWQ